MQTKETQAVVPQWIGGEEAHAAEAYELYDPSTAAPYGTAADGTEVDVDRAIESAWKAFQTTWSRVGSEERSSLLVQLADALEGHAGELANAESRDTGRPIALAEASDGHAVSHELRFYASAIRSVRDGLHAGSGQTIGMTLRQPYGVVGLIVPSNFPLGVLAEKVSQILAAGNCVVIKPSPLTPASTVLAARLMTEAGLPPGVVNVVLGQSDAVGRALVQHPLIPRVSFTGSTAVGKAILSASAPTLKHVTLELGGSNPVLVFPDADVAAAVETSVLSAFLHSGQLCTSGARILVHADVAEEFTERFLDRTATLRLGPREDRATQLSPLVSAAALDKVTAQIEKLKARHEVLYAGVVPAGLPGWHVAPHVFRADDGSVMGEEEVFGPVVSITTFRDEAAALALANATPFGLASFVWTNDFPRIMRCIRELEAGRVWVNTGHRIPPDMSLPGWKMSGLGAEGGLEGLASFSRKKTANLRFGGPVPSFPDFG